ncbi:MAG: hypothetical protein GXO89_09235 [Chlorobi bacterium]|nr:hypothetical protein [Chlorobiota bacterium]
MRKTILYIAIYLFATSFSLAQVSLDNENLGFLENLDEQLQFFTDRDFYLSGEEVWFTAYVAINNTYGEQELSEVAYVECFDFGKKKIYKGKFKIKNNTAKGSFQIPPETLSGNYFIRAYTQYQRNFPPETFSTKTISIINPEFPLPKQQGIIDTVKTGIGDPDFTGQDFMDEIRIKLGTDKTSYGNRERVELNIQVPDVQMAGLCVSVIRQGTLRQPEENSVPVSNEIPGKGSEDVFWVPETRGVNISGVVSEENSRQGLGGTNVYLTVLGGNPQFHIAQTKENGEFVFSLGHIPLTNEIFIGVKPQKDKELQLYVNNDFSDKFAVLPNIPFSIDTSDRGLIEEMLVNYQSQKVFGPSGTETLTATHSLNRIFNQPDISVQLSDFIDLKDMKTVFFELIPTVFIRNKNGGKSIYVANPATEWVFENELLLLDYVPVFDLDAILAIPTERIDQVYAMNNTWYLGDNTLRNVVMINSKGQDFAGYDFPNGSIFIDYQTLAPETNFKSPNYENQQGKPSPIPDFRTLLYWNPELKIAKGDTTLRFYTSDNKGNYEIIVRGITKNGESCFGRGSIHVQ